MTSKNFKENLAKLKGMLSKNAFAKRCGISYSTMNSYLSGNSEPDVSNLLKIANATNADVGWLVGENGKKQNAEVVATVEPGEIGKERLRIQNERPTAKNINLRLIVEWLDTEYAGENETQSVFFMDDIRKRYKSFERFLEKKQQSGGAKNGEKAALSANGNN